MSSYRFRAEKYVSREFKDLSVSFNENPNTKDFGIVKNENAIKQSVRNLILTSMGDKPFQETVGSNVKSILFEQWDVFTKDSLEDNIRDVIARFEPRIVVESVDIEDESDINSLEVSINYVIVGQTFTQNIAFLLEKT